MRIAKKIYDPVRSLLRKGGVDVSHYALPRLLRSFNPSIIIDVGANVGQYGLELRAAGYHGAIISFEPLSEAHSALQAVARGDKSWSVAERMALGSKPGIAELHIARNSWSSSLLPMTDNHSEASPDSVYVGNELVQVQSLDSALSGSIELGSRAMLKLDVQGYELEVLRGAENTLKHVQTIQIEVSFVELYRGEPLFFEVMNWMDRHSFDIYSIESGFIEPVTGQRLQADCFYRRRSGCV